jgi:hypothetical protein
LHAWHERLALCDQRPKDRDRQRAAELAAGVEDPNSITRLYRSTAGETLPRSPSVCIAVLDEVSVGAVVLAWL